MKPSARRGEAAVGGGRPSGRPAGSRSALAVEPRSGSSSLPTGNVTFLFTDIEGSTRLLGLHPRAYPGALTRHDTLLRQAVTAHHGCVFETVGDAFYAAFSRPSDALAAALQAQQALLAEDWGEVGQIKARMGLHTGEVEVRGEHYFGVALYRCARLMAIGHGGQTLLSGVSADLVRDGVLPGTTVRDLGQHQLKDLERPEQVWQLVHPDLPAEFPPLGSVKSVRHNLPAQATPFIGRQQTVEAIKMELGSEGVRLLSLIGPGGIGKTRLGLQVAAELVERFDDGVFFVPLARIADPSLVASTMAGILGVREAGGHPVLQDLKEQLGTKELLLVLDNFEHLLAATPLVAELLDACPRLSALVTSRSVLRLAREHIFEVPPLAAPDPQLVSDIEATGQYDAVQLFCERAQAVRPDFALTTENVGAVVEICKQLDGLPLAIELAAARVRVFAPHALLARLSSRLGLLTGGARDVPVRHQTLRGAIAWSYELLTGPEQRLFAWLAVFAGGCTLEAAEAVANADAELGIAALDGVAALVDQSLLKRVEGELGEPRFGLLETLREYAQERLVAGGEELSTRERHAQYFIGLAEAAEPRLRDREQAEWLARLEREHDNLRAVLRWCVQTREAEQGLRLGGALWRFWQVHGHFTEGREHLAAVLRLGGAGTAARASALTGAGSLAWCQGDYAQAHSLHEESLAIWRELGDRQGIAQSLNNLGIVAWCQGDHALACSTHEESLAISRELGHRLGIANSLNNLGLIAQHQEDYVTARSLLEESLAITRELGDRRGIASSLSNLGIVAWRQSDYAAARSLHQESLVISREHGHRLGIVESLEDFARMAAAQGQARRALQLAGSAARLRETIGAPLPPAEQEQHRRTLQPAEQALSEQERVAAWAEGEAMPLEQALDHALATGEARSLLPPHQRRQRAIGN